MDRSQSAWLTRVAVGIAGIVGVVALAASGCVVAKDARIAAENAIDPKTVHEFPWGRVECGEGQVCSEVSVTRVDIHGDPPGRSFASQNAIPGAGGHGFADAVDAVEVTLENRTLESVAVQVQIETFNKRGERTDRSGFHDVALAPRSQSVITLWQDVDERNGETLVIRLRARGA